MNDFIDYFNKARKLEYRGVSIKRDLDWWMGSIGNKLFKLLFVGILMLAFAFVYLFWNKFNDSQSFPTKNIKLQGNFLLTNQEDVNKVLAMQTQKSFFNIDLDQVVKSVEQLKWVKKAQAKRMNGHQIGVAIVESIPTYRWKSNYLIDDDGQIFLKRLSHHFDYLPQLDGPWGKEHEVTQSYGYLNHLLNQEKVNLRINKFEMNQYRSIVLHLNNGVMIKFGRDKFTQRAMRFINAFKENKLPDFSKVSIVDMRYKNGFSIKWKEQYAETINAQLVLLSKVIEGTTL